MIVAERKSCPHAVWSIAFGKLAIINGHEGRSPQSLLLKAAPALPKIRRSTNQQRLKLP